MATSDTVPSETPAPPSEGPVPSDQPDQQIADANGAASAADKEWYRRKNHGGTGA